MLVFLLTFAFSLQHQNIRRPQIAPKNSFPNRRNLNTPDNVDSCEMCTKVVDYVEYLMNNTFIESEIASLVSLLCQTLPFPVSTGCSLIVKHYIPLIMKLIEQDIESIHICNKIGFCSALQVHNYKHARLPRIKKNQGFNKQRYFVADQKTCLMCKDVIRYAEAAILDEKIEEQVIDVVDKVCESFSTPLDNLCKAVFKISVPTIMTWLEEGIEAIDVCVRLLLCEE